MNSPYRAHPALHSQAPAGNTIPFPAGAARPAPPAPARQEGAGKLAKLLKLEGEIRQQPTRMALVFHCVNDSREVLGFAQSFFFRMNRRKRLQLESVSSVASVDVNAPLAQAMTRAINSIEVSKRQAISLERVMKAAAYPHGHGLWLPLVDRKGRVFAGLLCTRNEPWTEADGQIGARIAEAYGHGFRALSPPSLLRSISIPRWALYGVPLSALLLGVIPVPLTALAPFEVVAHQPTIMTAPMDGAIAEIVAEPNQFVEKGAVLWRFDATTQQAEADVASKRVAVAESKLSTARSSAFADKDVKRTLAVTEKELELAKAELDYALSLLAKVEVRAPEAGLLVYSSKSDWIGRPVAVGEKVMEIAEPSRTAYRISLGVHDSIALQEGAAVRLFLDADPLKPRRGSIHEMSYHAAEEAGGTMAYVIRALPPTGEDAPRIGLRGTAQVIGGNVPLGFYVLRRPIAAVRQYFGV